MSVFLPRLRRWSSAASWRAFAAPRYRSMHRIAIAQGLLGGLLGDALWIPLLLSLGVSPALVTLIAALPLAGAASQRAMPRLLDRFDGNLRGLTLAAVAAGETRGFAFAGLAAAAALGASPTLVAIGVALVLASGQTLGIIAGANLQSWYAILLPEADRRLVAPRLSAISIGLTGVVLLPVAVLLDASAGLGAWLYVPLFAAGGLASLLLLSGVRQLPHPGRVRVPSSAAIAAEMTPELRRFVRHNLVHALGQGIQPYVSIFAIAVLGMSPGLAVALAALACGTNLLGSLVASSYLTHGSSSRLLRVSFWIRAAAMLVFAAALPGSALAVPLLVAGTLLNSAGWSTGMLAANERLFRLTAGPATIAHQARYVAGTNLAALTGQATMAAVLGLTGGWAVFAGLFCLSAAFRTRAALTCEVSRVSAREPSHSAALPAGTAPAAE